MFKRSLVLLVISGVFLSMLACNLATFLPNNEGQAKAGDTIFSDDFSDSNSGWDTWSNDTASVTYAEGGLRIIVNQPRYDYWSRPGKRFDNVQISVDATRLNGPQDNDYGIICRFVDRNNFYALVISSDGYAGILKVKDGIYSVISAESMQYSPQVKQGGALNRLRAVCSGSDLTLQVNGQAVVNASDSDFASGEVGLMAGAYAEPGVDILFDNFEVQKK